MTINLADKKYGLPICLEESAYEGVLEIAGKVAQDIALVTGTKPQVCVQKEILGACVFAGTVGRSAYLEKLQEEQKIDLSQVEGKREVYSLTLTEHGLMIAGSDKLGTIYGLFALSEYIGVSPQCYFGDAAPLKREQILLKEDINTVSKEPSVRYRGFFINDEWPCFGNWTCGHFGGFTAQMYDHVFEFLLRMKGNYLWPAMWTSSFPLDGPGSLNEELAAKYGITVAYSHHEPCLRASEEWDKVRGEDSVYGNEWNFYTNKEGLTRYWADALKRSGKYNHMITIGMRGERDSSMMGPDATLKDNIDLLKEIITTQRNLIRQYVNEDVDKEPQLLALYKEVEAYFYGDEKTEGLKDWKELENVIFMLCEDNFGHMRTLPTEDIRDHKGGFGMYYHLDYHGGPVSYEWMPSTPLALVWEQMTQAYDYGIRDVWVVNVGDLKGNEIALEYFLTLAYDFEAWGSSRVNSWKEYLLTWAKRTFPGASKEQQADIAWLYKEFVHMNFMRRPEVLQADTYHPTHFGEADRMLALTDALEAKNEELYNSLNGVTREAFYSLIAHPVRSSVTLARMQLYAGKNQYYAKQGRKVANLYGEKLKQAIRDDRALAKAFGEAFDGKWKGMELEEHIGFTKWNDDGWRYPLCYQVEPVTKPRISVSRADRNELAVKNYGAPSVIVVNDFLTPGVPSVTIEISNDGVGSIAYEVCCEQGKLPEWLAISKTKGVAEDLDSFQILCKEGHLPKEASKVRLLVVAGDTTVAVDVSGKAYDTSALPPMTFLPRDGVVAMDALHYAAKVDTEKARFTLLEEYGRTGCGMKVLPSTCDFEEGQEKPALTYRFLCEEDGEYVVELWSSPSNALVNRRPLQVETCFNETQHSVVTLFDEEYKGGDYMDSIWSSSVMEQIRKTSFVSTRKAGINELTIKPLQAGFVLERILIYKEGKRLPASYLGPIESYYKK